MKNEETPTRTENRWLVNYIYGLMVRGEYDKADAYVDNFVKERIERSIQRERERIAEEYSNHKDSDGRSLRFYLLPSSKHKPGDDGHKEENNHPNFWGMFCICKKCCDRRRR